MRIPTLLLIVSVTGLFCEYAKTQVSQSNPPADQGTPAPQPEVARPKPAPRVISPLEQQEIDAREHQILRQKLFEFKERKRGAWGEIPVPRGHAEPQDIEYARQKVGELEGLIKMDAVVMRGNQRPAEEPGTTVAGPRIAEAGANQPALTATSPSPAPAASTVDLTPPGNKTPSTAPQPVSAEAIDRAMALLIQRIAEFDSNRAPVKISSTAAPSQPEAITVVPPAQPATVSPLPQAIALAQNGDSTVNSEAMERAVKLLRQKVAELEGTAPPAIPPVSPPAVAEPPSTAPQVAQSALPVVVDSEAMDRAVRILRQRIAEMEKQNEEPVPTTPPAISVFATQPYPPPQIPGETPATSPAPATAPSQIKPLAPVPAVPTPVGRETGYPLKSKQQQLSDLLQLYKTDAITAREYQEKRAKILSDQ
jgi:hypothetical protein